MSIKANFPDIKPSLILDFANTKRLDPRITFTRATTATYYDGKTVAKAEENLLTLSTTFGSWSQNGVSLASGYTAPDGTSTAFLLTATADSVARLDRLYQKTQSGTVFSVYIKQAAVTTSMLIGQNNQGDRITVTITSDWQRFDVYRAAGSDRLVIFFADGALTAGESVYVWAPQLEYRETPTAYTPTTTQPITNYIPVLQSAASGEARFDHDPVTGESKGLLIEEQRTNLFTYSEQFDDASWGKTRLSVTANAILAPDGTLTADKLVENTDNNSRSIGKNANASSVSSTVTGSVYLKAGERTFAQINLTDNAADVSGGINDFRICVDLTNGTISPTTISNGSPTNPFSSITSVGDGWYRVSIGLTKKGDAVRTDLQVFPYTQATPSANPTYTGDGYSGIYIWGAQLEEGAFPTSYIPTVASQVTRNADVASMTGANLFSWFNPSQGTVYAEANHIVGVNQQAFFAQIAGTGSGTSYGESIAIGKFGASAINSGQRIKGIVYVINADVANLATASDITTSPVKVSLGYKVNDFAASIDGATALTDISGVLPVINSAGVFSIGSIRGGGYYTNSTIKKLAYYPARLSNTELQGLTS
jgi:hypothetical protein